MKINKVDLENFKGIEKAEINFGDLTVITGKNSSGKSSVIQSLKYMTQWLKRVKTTRGLTEFSAPSMQVIHPDFITENKDYEAIRNSKAPSSAGVALGIELNDSDNEFFMNRTGVFTLHAEFENISQEGNKVRPKTFFLRKPKHWNEIRSEFNDEKYSVIYHNTTNPQLSERKNKYIEMYGNGQLVDRVLNEKKYYEGQRASYIPILKNETSKKAYLHLLSGHVGLDDFDKDSVSDEKHGFIKSIQNIQIDAEHAGEVANEKALIINSENERFSFDNASTLKIKQYSGEKSVFFDLFEDYIINSLKEPTNNLADVYDMEEDTLLILLELVIKIYHSEKKYRLLLSEYLQFDIKDEKKYLDALMKVEEVETVTSDLDTIDNLNLKFLSDKAIPKKVMKDFEAITKIANSSTDPTSVIGAVQILLMYVDYINNLAVNRNALNLSRTMQELVNSKELFELDEMDNTLYIKPIDVVTDIQNCLGEASKLIGYKWTDEAEAKGFGGSEECTCEAQNAWHLMDPKQELIRPLDPWEVLKPCPDKLSIVEHIYSLTTEEEVSSNEPNAYTLRPKANIRGNKFSLSLTLGFLNNIMKKQSSESFELYFNMLNDDALKNDQAYQKSKTYLNSDKEYDEVRSEVLKIEEFEQHFTERRDEVAAELRGLESQIDIFEGTSLADDHLDGMGTLNYEDEDFSEFEDEILDYERKNYDESVIKEKIKKLTIIYDDLRQKLSDLKKDKTILLTKLKELTAIKDEFDEPWEKQLIKKILILINTKYVSIESTWAPINIDSLSTDLKFLNTGRNPAAPDRPGEFYDNLPVGKIGGRLTDLMYEEGKTKIYPYLYPSVREYGEENYTHSRNFDDLDWHTIRPEDEKFVTAFNMWISYLNMEVSKVASKIEGPKPQLKVTGKDGIERDVFEVGSGIGQVLPVIAICLLSKPGEIVCIEEPEAHLHPSAQAYLADFLLAMAASGRQIIVETHSPNIIDRLRLRKVHRKSWKKFQNNEWIKSELYLDDVVNIEKKYKRFREPDIKIIFAEQDYDGFSNYREASIDRKGDIIFGESIDEIWPDGFFDNAQQELSYILKARISAEEE
jgi:AAA15 family ATPase/GTPase